MDDKKIFAHKREWSSKILLPKADANKTTHITWKPLEKNLNWRSSEFARKKEVLCPLKPLQVPLEKSIAFRGSTPVSVRGSAPGSLVGGLQRLLTSYLVKTKGLWPLTSHLFTNSLNCSVVFLTWYEHAWKPWKTFGAKSEKKWPRSFWSDCAGTLTSKCNFSI